MKKFTPTLNIADALSFFDWAVFSLVILGTISFVLYGQGLRKKKSSEEDHFLDLLLMGRQLTLPLFIATLVATWYGGIFGVTQIAFEKGIYNWVTQGFFWYVSYLLFAFFLVKKVKKSQAKTLPELVTQMFGPRSGYLSAIFNFFNVVPIAYAISIGILGQMIFGGSLTINIIAGVFFVIAYSLFGGLRAVVFSDLFQFFVMCSGVLLVIIYSFGTFGGLEFLRSQLPARYFMLGGEMPLSTTFVWGFIALSTLVDPNFYSRVFAARNEKTAKKGIIWATLIWICFDFCTTFGAMYAKALIPDADSTSAYLIYALQLLPHGLRGFFIAGIVATILSTMDSYIFIAGTTISYDLLPKKMRGSIRAHHLGVLTVGLLAIIMSLLFEGNIKSVWKTLGSYSSACLLFPVLLGHLFPGKIKDKQFVFSCLLGVIATTYWRNTEHTGFWIQVDELYAGLFATSAGIFLSFLYLKTRPAFFPTVDKDL